MVAGPKTTPRQITRQSSNFSAAQPSKECPAPASSDAAAGAFLAKHQHDVAVAYVSILPSGETPHTLKEAFASVDSKHWRFATAAEVDQLEKTLTWELVD